jgi:putative phosphoribosyl transferase
MINPNRYADLRAGGRQLASALLSHKDRADAVVLGIALGGAPVAFEVANALEFPLDLMLIRRLLIGDDGSHLCAVNVAGTTVLDEGIAMKENPKTPKEIFLGEALADFARREQLCRRGRDPLSLTDRHVFVIDCGIRTGSTMQAAARALRKTGAKSIIGAIPAASREGYAAVTPLFDELICLQQPEQFVNAGFWYADFGRPSDEEVGELLVR